MAKSTYNDVFGERGRDRFDVARRRMVSEQIIAGGIKDRRVIAAMEKVPRHAFVSKGMEEQAYLDRPLPIGLGQTISQPLMVAIMTELLELKGHERILEIGTGSGYQAAILAELATEVYTVERFEELSLAARKTLYKLGYKNVSFRIGDGTLGWPEASPFDGILVTAGAPVVPETLEKQLSDGGRIVIPVGGEDVQTLQIIRREGDKFHRHHGTACRFVKLVGTGGWREGE